MPETETLRDAVREVTEEFTTSDLYELQAAIAQIIQERKVPSLLKAKP